MNRRLGTVAAPAFVTLALVAASCAPAASTSQPPPTNAAGEPSTVAPSAAAAPSVAPAIQPSAVAQPPGGSPQPDKVTISYAALSVGDLPYYAAISEGFFQRQGIDLNFVVMAADTSVAALNSGEIDFTDSPSNIVLGAFHGLDMKVLLFAWKASPWVLVGKPDIASVAGLRGKVVAVSQAGSTPALYLRAALQQAGMSYEDVTPIYTGGTTQTVTTLLAGQADAGVVSPPYDAQVEGQGLREIQFLGSLLQVPYIGLGTSPRVLQTRRPVAVRVARALIDAVAWLRGHPDEATDLLASYLRVPNDQARATIEEVLPLLAQDYQPTIDSIQQGLDAQSQVSDGQPSPVTPQQIIDTGPLTEAMARSTP